MKQLRTNMTTAKLPFSLDGSPSLSMSMDGVDIWQVDLDSLPDESLPHLRQWLSAEEIARVERLVPPVPKRRSLVMRSVLRWLLSGYLRSKPEEVTFGYGPLGKPFVMAARDSLSFNVSHSQDFGLIAVAGCEVGIDVEKRRGNLSMVSLVERYFAEREKNRFRQLPEAEQAAWFFCCWTRKEALLKACGTGIHVPLDQVDIGGDERGTFPMTWQERAWSVMDLSEPESHFVTVVMEGEQEREVRQGRIIQMV
jgi:4'-phosphopantetheinyl transferase